MNNITSLKQKTDMAHVRGKTVSPLGRVVLEILAIVWRGLHHIDQRQLAKVDWSDDYVISINFDRANWATTDFNELTQLVVLAHDANVRMGICSPAMKTLRLVFHKRKPEGEYTQRQETLEKAAELVRAQYTIGEQIV